jgi:hypothetical protein
VAAGRHGAEPLRRGSRQYGDRPGHPDSRLGLGRLRRLRRAGGLDYDGDGASDLFVGDITGNCGPVSLSSAGSGHVFFNSALLKGQTFLRDSPPVGVATTDFFGKGVNDLAADTALQGDFDNDGVDDLAFSSPHGDPLGRSDAGILHIFFGRSGGWPLEIDLGATYPSESLIRITDIYGANGSSGGDEGDTLAYSGAPADVNGDRRMDLIVNEMLGNGVLPAAEDTGNLIVVSGSIVSSTKIPLAPPIGALFLTGAIGWVARRAWRGSDRRA